MSEPLLHVEHLSVTYNEGKPNEMRSLQGVNLDIYPEEYVIIFGPSGCGKSTLLYSLAALQSPTSGEISFNGNAFSQMSKKDKLLYHQLGMGMIFQAFFLIPSLTVIDNICLPRLFRNEEKKTRREEGMRLLKRFGILEQAFKFPSELSGGQKQRASIARSLINKPDIIFADEPVGNLDSASATNVMEILKELNEVDKKTIVLVTHEPSHLPYGDRILYMKDGQVVKEEIHKEKRANSGTSSTAEASPMKRLPELEILLRTFQGMPQEQASLLLLPYKIKQLMFHIFSEITEEQVKITEGFLKDYFFKSFDKERLIEVLDAPFIEGGANWNMRRAVSFSDRVEDISSQAEKIKATPGQASETLSDYLIRVFELSFDEDHLSRFKSFLAQRTENTMDSKELTRLLDASWEKGGLGLHRFTAERIAREIEIIFLLKY